jgi:hypothetical protein
MDLLVNVDVDDLDKAVPRSWLRRDRELTLGRPLEYDDEGENHYLDAIKNGIGATVATSAKGFSECIASYDC